MSEYTQQEIGRTPATTRSQLFTPGKKPGIPTLAVNIGVVYALIVSSASC